ncbi:MAG TPA: hypothetical protein VF904_12040, partial [Anaeromyxobacteraceae bacterium]
DGSLLALSAAMPGLVGATLRRSGPYAVMRAAITRTADRTPQEARGGTIVIRLKLFNLLLEEMGPVLLERGMVLDRGDVLDVLGDRAEALTDLPAGGKVELTVRVSG